MGASAAAAQKEQMDITDFVRERAVALGYFVEIEWGVVGLIDVVAVMQDDDYLGNQVAEHDHTWVVVVLEESLGKDLEMAILLGAADWVMEH